MTVIPGELDAVASDDAHARVRKIPMDNTRTLFALPAGLRRQLLMPLAMIAATKRLLSQRRIVRRRKPVATCKPGRPKMRLKKSLKRPAMPPAPLQIREWIAPLAGAGIVKARTKSEARAQFKRKLEQMTGRRFDRLPPSTLLLPL